MRHIDQLKLEYTANLINEIEEILGGAKVVSQEDSVAVISRGQILAITPKTEDPHDDVDRLCGFLYHMIQSGGRIFAPLGRYRDHLSINVALTKDVTDEDSD